MQSYNNESLALSQAKVNSTVYNKTYYVILSKGAYYVDDTDFVRSWETLIYVVENGEIKDDE